MTRKNERYQYLVKLIRKVARISGTVYKYQSTPRTYGAEGLPYMREAHFIDVLGSGELDMGQIAEKLEVTGGTASQIASGLEKRGYIIRKKDASDSKHITYVMTEEAQKALAFHRERNRDTYGRFEELMAEFAEKGLKVCDRFLDNVNRFYQMAVGEKKQCNMHKIEVGDLGISGKINRSIDGLTLSFYNYLSNQNRFDIQNAHNGLFGRPILQMLNYLLYILVLKIGSEREEEGER